MKMTAREKEEKVLEIRRLIDEKCSDISNISRTLSRNESVELIMKTCRKIEDSIADIRRLSKRLEDIEQVRLD